MLSITENTYNVTLASLTTRYTVPSSRDTKGPYVGTVTVEWSGLHLMDCADYEGWLKKLTRSDISPDSLVGAVYSYLDSQLNPHILRVTLMVETTAHGLYQLTKEGGQESE